MLQIIHLTEVSCCCNLLEMAGKKIMLQVQCMKIITQNDELISYNNNHNHPLPDQAVNETEEVIYTLLREKVSRVYNYHLTITKMRFSTLLGHQTRKPNY